jgi:hypothetical protein
VLHESADKAQNPTNLFHQPNEVLFTLSLIESARQAKSLLKDIK